MKILNNLILTSIAMGTISVYADTTISVPSNANINYFGHPDTATYGQTFTVPSLENVLSSWTFSLQNHGGTDQNFKFFVMGWDSANMRATGSVLYQSGLTTITGGTTSMTDFTVNPNVSLNSGGEYVMFLNESGLNGYNGEVVMAGNNSASSYTGGQFVFLNNGDNFGEVTQQTWSDWSVRDTAFTATFIGGSNSGTVPDAGSTLGILSLALGVLGVLKRKRIA
jgi:hypothetical protein